MNIRREPRAVVSRAYLWDLKSRRNPSEFWIFALQMPKKIFRSFALCKGKIWVKMKREHYNWYLVGIFPVALPYNVNAVVALLGRCRCVMLNTLCFGYAILITIGTDYVTPEPMKVSLRN
uniref:Uncharacterized protein n=1 Tax=Glossina austeni TaxID=7395 RepID=A0A1A9V4H8_GLOAU